MSAKLAGLLEELEVVPVGQLGWLSSAYKLSRRGMRVGRRGSQTVCRGWSDGVGEGSECAEGRPARGVGCACA